MQAERALRLLKLVPEDPMHSKLSEIQLLLGAQKNGMPICSESQPHHGGTGKGRHSIDWSGKYAFPAHLPWKIAVSGVSHGLELVFTPLLILLHASEKEKGPQVLLLVISYACVPHEGC
jgi:hypothetical protein